MIMFSTRGKVRSILPTLGSPRESGKKGLTRSNPRRDELSWREAPPLAPPLAPRLLVVQLKFARNEALQNGSLALSEFYSVSSLEPISKNARNGFFSLWDGSGKTHFLTSRTPNTKHVPLTRYVHFLRLVVHP